MVEIENQNKMSQNIERGHNNIYNLTYKEKKS